MRGRPQRPHKCSWNGKLIDGLYHCPDGRWRINATGQKFSEPDERLAVARFRAWQEKHEKKDPIDLPVGTVDDVHEQLAPLVRQAAKQEIRIAVPLDHTQQVTVYRRLEKSPEVFSFFRDAILTRPDWLAERCGLPQLAGFARAVLPMASIKLADVIDVYKRENPSTPKSKKEALAVVQRLIDHAGAKVLDDLTQEKLKSFRQSVESSGSLKSAGTRAAYYGRVKSVVGFGLKVGLDQQQIRACLDRCKVLWTAEALPPVQPRPISREHFHKLLNAGNGTWRAWLLTGLNCCMHMEEVCGLRWDELDLERGTYAAIRGKTRRKRIPRAATLWPETVAALKLIPRRGQYVFISTHGTRYNKNTRVNDFRELRIKAGLPDEVTFDTLRDGSYTAAINAPDVEERFARVLAGHTSPGLQDSYVLRNPQCTRSACDAVHRHYGPF